MKNKTTIIAVAIAVVVAGAGIGFWQWQKAKTDKIKADTVTLELEGYDLAFSAWLPKDKFKYEIDKSKTSRPLPFPAMYAEDKEGTYRIRFTVDESLVRYKQLNYDRYKKEQDFKDIKGNEKKGELSGFSYYSKYGIRTMLDLKEKGEDLYRLNVVVSSIKDAEHKSKEAFEREDVQKMLSSLRLVKDYKAPERDYMTNNLATIIVKKAIAKEIDGFKLQNKTANTSSFEMEAKKNDLDSVAVEFYSLIREDDINKVIANDSEVKKGDRTYAEKKTIAEYQVAFDAKKVGSGAVMRANFYAMKENNKTIKGVMRYLESDRVVAEKLLEELLKNAEFHKS